MALGTLTRATLRQRVAGILGLNAVITGTATDTTNNTNSTAQLVDGRDGFGLLDSAHGSERFGGNGIVALHAGAASTAYEWARIQTYVPAEGVVKPGRTFAVAPTTAVTTYELHTGPSDPDSIHTALQWCCRSLHRPVLAVLAGLVPDGDCEVSGVTSWGTVSNTTAAKTTTEANVAWGERALSLTNSAANGYLPSAAVPVKEERQYRVFALCKSTTGAASIVVRDRTNGANITVTWANLTKIDAADSTDWRYLSGAFETPSGCVSLELRLTNDNASGVCYFDNVLLYPQDTLHLDLPTWLVDPEQQILDVQAQVYINTGKDDYYLEKIRPYYGAEGNPTGQTAWRIRLPQALSRPVLIHAIRPLSEMTAETDTIPDMYGDVVVVGALSRLYEGGARPRGMDAKEFAIERDRARLEWQGWLSVLSATNRFGRPVRARE